MRPTCLYCHRRLPPNDVIEAFPFARRVAYDPARLRFWVVCRCGKWSLAPMEEDERSAAVDQMERWWRGSPAKYTTGGIGLGRLSRDFSVVRVGDASWNEFASWRYAPVLKRRRLRMRAGTYGPIALAAGLWQFGAIAFSTAIAPVAAIWASSVLTPGWLRGKRPVCLVPAADGTRQPMRRRHLRDLELVRAAGGAWSLLASHDGGTAGLTDNEGIRVLGYSLPRINFTGGTDRDVESAMRVIADAGGPEAIAEKAAQPLPVRGRDERLVVAYPTPVRLALEMATHEYTERRRLEDELALLRAEWREAEEIAAITDRLT